MITVEEAATALANISLLAPDERTQCDLKLARRIIQHYQFPGYADLLEQSAKVQYEALREAA